MLMLHKDILKSTILVVSASTILGASQVIFKAEMKDDLIPIKNIWNA